MVYVVKITGSVDKTWSDLMPCLLFLVVIGVVVRVSQLFVMILLMPSSYTPASISYRC
jgi:hypothetical protein